MQEQRPLPRPRALMLAAGSGVRFGSDKRRSVLEDRRTLLHKSVDCFRRAGVQVLLCLSDRRGDDDLEHEFSSSDVDCVRCTRAAAGMGATLAEGASRCGGDPGVFVALADMPLIDPGTILTLERHLSRDGIAYPSYRGRRGHPVLFGADYIPELQLLDGDQGASSLLKAYAARCHEVAVSDPGVVLDADTPQALAELQQFLAKRVVRD